MFRRKEVWIFHQYLFDPHTCEKKHVPINGLMLRLESAPIGHPDQGISERAFLA